jgi:hypothetical protein
MEGVERTERSTVDSQQGYIETPLNIDLDINNKRQECKIGAVGV